MCCMVEEYNINKTLEELIVKYSELRSKNKLGLFNFYFGNLLRKIVAIIWIRKDTEINEKDLLFMNKNSELFQHIYEEIFEENSKFYNISKEDLKELKHRVKFLIKQYEDEKNFVNLGRKTLILVTTFSVILLTLLIHLIFSFLGINKSLLEIKDLIFEESTLIWILVFYLVFNFTQYYRNIESKVVILMEILEFLEYRIEKL